MNWLLIVISAIFLVCIIVGICKGAIKIAVSLATTIVTLIIVFLATPYVAKGITKFTPMDEMIKNQVVSAMTTAATTQMTEEGGMTQEGVEKALDAAGVSEDMLAQYGVTIEDIVEGRISSDDLAQYGISSNVLDGLNATQQSTIEEALSEAQIPRDMQMAAIEAADLPDVFKDLLSVNNNSEIYEELGVETFAQYVGNYLAKLLINIVAFLCTFIIVTIILRAVVFALDIVSDLPVLGFINRLLGGVIGVLCALIITWLIFILVTLMYTMPVGKEIYQMIQSNAVLKLLYEYNPIMNLATIFR